MSTWAQGKTVDPWRTGTSYLDMDWSVFPQHKDSSIQWIPEQKFGIGEDFHNQVYDGKVKEGLVAVTWSVDQEFQNFSFWRRWRWNDTGGGSPRVPISWRVDIGKTNSFYLQRQLQSGRHLSLLSWPASRTHSCQVVNQTYPDVVRTWRQFHLENIFLRTS